MDNQITKSDFKTPYTVSVKDKTPIDPTETFLNELIAEHQEKILRQILGFQLYNEMETDILEDIWVEFFAGKTYTENGVKYVYKGMKHILCRFVYFYWHEAKSNDLVPDGAVQIAYEQSMKVIPEYKMQAQYNTAIEFIQSDENYFPSVYHYLDTHLTGNDSHIWEFTPYDEGLNGMGI